MTRTTIKIISLIFTIIISISCDTNSRDYNSESEKTKSLIAPELYKAQEYLQRQMYRDALQIADSLIAVSPDIPELHYLKGKIFFQLKQYEKSKSAFNQVMSLDENYQSVHYQLGNIAFVQENYNTALAQYETEESLRINDEQFDLKALSAIWIQMGRCHDRLGNTESSIDFFNKILARDSTNAEAFADLGQLYKNNGEFQKAKKYYKNALQYDPDNTEYQYFYGYLLLNSGETEQAIQLFNSILEEKAWHYSTHYHLGRALLQEGSTQEAEMHMTIADSLQDIDYSIATAEWTVEVYPHRADAWIKLGELLRKVGRNLEALDAFRSAAFLEPENLQTQNKIANICVTVGLLEEAIARYKSILKMDPSSEIIWFNLGLVYAKNDDKRSARIAMKKSLDLNPDFEMAKRYLTAFE